MCEACDFCCICGGLLYWCTTCDDGYCCENCGTHKEH